MFGKRVDLYIMGVVDGREHVGGGEVGVVVNDDHDDHDDHLYVVGVVYCWKHVGGDEVGVVGQPADQEEGHHAHHHLHHLGINIIIMKMIIRQLAWLNIWIQ